MLCHSLISVPATVLCEDPSPDSGEAQLRWIAHPATRRPPSNGGHSGPVSEREACATDCLIELLRIFFCEVEYCQSSENGARSPLLASRRGSRVNSASKAKRRKRRTSLPSELKRAVNCATESVGIARPNGSRASFLIGGRTFWGGGRDMGHMAGDLSWLTEDFVAQSRPLDYPLEF